MTEQTSTRTPREIMRAHGKALLSADLEAVVENYAPDATFITPAGVYRGRDGVREAQAIVLSELAHARFEYLTHQASDDVMFIEWRAEGEGFTVDHGVDTLVFADGYIRAQTLRYTVQRTDTV